MEGSITLWSVQPTGSSEEEAEEEESVPAVRRRHKVAVWRSSASGETLARVGVEKSH